jgi:hypothetical protein
VTRPLCRYCGKPIAKRAGRVTFGSRENHRSDVGYVQWLEFADKPTSREQAQRLVGNLQIISVKWERWEDHDTWWRQENPRYEPWIRSAGLWDGETYEDEFFCSGDHAKNFAYVMARAGKCTRAYLEALDKAEEV